MGAAPIDIRPGSTSDLPAVSDLLVTTWHDSYDVLLGPGRVTEITKAWHSIEALAPQLDLPKTSFLIAGLGGTVVGHLFASAQRLPALVLSRLYVLPRFQRRGIGARLLAAALERHPEAELVRLDVAAGNEKAISFYRRQGFEPVGVHCDAGIEHIRMERGVSPGD